MAILSCLTSEPCLLLTLKRAHNKCLNLKIKITFLLEYLGCAINHAIFSHLNGLTQWLPKWGKLLPGLICDLLGLPWNENFLYYERSLQNIKSSKTNRYLD